ncbi:MAG TPA: mechanosensitive ion channel family protein [Planctomycetota bacterium]|nr:mechanosensitive ion channel family protein [Planctomycetota bacterium]
MSFTSELFSEASADHTFVVAACFVATVALGRALAPADRRQLTGSAILLVVHALLLPLVALARVEGPATGIEHELRLVCLITEAMATIGMASLFLFDVALPVARVNTPSILRDLIAGVAAIVTSIVIANRLHFNLSGIIATSAVMTAVIGFSLQDTLGNVMGGLALQLDNSIAVGDWVIINGQTGKVSEIRWRYTAMETRNWETVIVPNSMLMKGQVLVLGRKKGHPVYQRRYINFYVDYRVAPGEVIRVIDEAVQAAPPMERVALDPMAHTVLMDLDEGLARYAVRYWLTDIAVDNRTDTLVRARIYAALKRAAIPWSMPAVANFVTVDTPRRRRSKARRENERRIAALSHVSLLKDLSAEDRSDLARKLSYTPFARGEALTRQGAEAHWLYVVDKGRVSVRVAIEGNLQSEVAQLEGGSFFGEMSLMTGEPRAATVVALSDVECYRLDKDAFQHTLRKRPELADAIAKLLAERRVALEATKETLTEEAKRRRVAVQATDILATIRRFFGLNAAPGAGEGGVMPGSGRLIEVIDDRKIYGED